MKNFWCCVVLLTITQPLFASQAIDYATRMGSTAGVVDACGGNADLLSKRTREAIRLMSSDANEVFEAQKSYDLSYRAQYNLQVSAKIVSCSQALKSYQDIPLLQEDYQKTVLGKIRKSTTTPRTLQYPPPNPAAKPNTINSNPRSTPNYPYY